MMNAESSTMISNDANAPDINNNNSSFLTDKQQQTMQQSLPPPEEAGREEQKIGLTMTTEPPPPKRLFRLSKPGIQSGVISASRSAAYATPESPLYITVETETKKGSFFPDGHDFSKKCKKIDSAVLACPVPLDRWSGEYYSEDQVRDDVFNLLLQPNLNVVFPKNSKGSIPKGVTRYCERELKTILREHAAKNALHNKKENGTLVIRDVEPGLLVKLSSKPDLCVFRGNDILVGELKQKGTYTKSNARRQCAVYCYAILYYYKVFLGLPVSHVFGFWLAGPRCVNLKGSGKYAVGLMQLAAPWSLGKLFRGREYSEEFDITSMDGVRLLVDFVTNGKRAIIPTNLQLCKEMRGPFLFPLPSCMWDLSTLDIEIVKGGTCAMVFKMDKTKVCDFLNANIQFTEQDKKVDDRTSTNFLRYVRSLQRSIQENKIESDCIYVKIKTKDTSPHYTPSFGLAWLDISEAHADDATQDHQKEALGEFLRTYAVRPFEAASFGLVIMADRGEPFQKRLKSDCSGTYEDLKQIAGMMSHMKSFADHLSHYIIHGDILLHNVVLDKRGVLVLIDFDEGVVMDKAINRRNLDSDNEYPWLQALFYPNALRLYPKKYTMVQTLALMFVSLYGTFAGRNENAILSEYEELGNCLLKLDISEKDTGVVPQGGIEQKTDEESEKDVPSEVLSMIDGLWERYPLQHTVVADTVDL